MKQLDDGQVMTTSKVYVEGTFIDLGYVIYEIISIRRRILEASW